MVAFNQLLTVLLVIPFCYTQECTDTYPAYCSKWSNYCSRFSVIRDSWCRKSCATCTGDDAVDAVDQEAACSANSRISTAATRQQFADDAIDFAHRIYTEAVKKAGDGNVFFSPTSVHMALGMVLLGAETTTEAEMKGFLAPTVPDDHVMPGYAWLMDEIVSDERNYELYTANSIYIDTRLSMLPSFSQSISQCFQSEANVVDFRDNPEEIRAEINDWVEENTNDKIQDLIPEGALNEDSAMVLVNAVYFKAEWLRKFSVSGRTFDGQFYRLSTPNEASEQKMMHMKTAFMYREVDGVKVLGLPYKDNELTMFIFLPRENDGLPAMERDLSSDDINRLMDGASLIEVEATIPKFSLTHDLPLKQVLKDMGMAEMFTDRADLSGIGGQRNLFVSDALHKAFIEVNENGTEAAAATSMLISLMSAPLYPPPTFVANHAFLFLIRHEATRQILFMGRLTDP